MQHLKRLWHTGWELWRLLQVGEIRQEQGNKTEWNKNDKANSDPIDPIIVEAVAENHPKTAVEGSVLKQESRDPPSKAIFGLVFEKWGDSHVVFQVEMVTCFWIAKYCSPWDTCVLVPSAQDWYWKDILCRSEFRNLEQGNILGYPDRHVLITESKLRAACRRTRVIEDVMTKAWVRETRSSQPWRWRQGHCPMQVASKS